MVYVGRQWKGNHGTKLYVKKKPSPIDEGFFLGSAKLEAVS